MISGRLHDQRHGPQSDEEEETKQATVDGPRSAHVVGGDIYGVGREGGGGGSGDVGERERSAVRGKKQQNSSPHT